MNWALHLSGEHDTAQWGEALTFDNANDLYVAGGFHVEVNVGGVVHKAPIGTDAGFIARISPTGSVDWSRLVGDSVVEGSVNVYAVHHDATSTYITGRF